MRIHTQNKSTTTASLLLAEQPSLGVRKNYYWRYHVCAPFPPPNVIARRRIRDRFVTVKQHFHCYGVVIVNFALLLRANPLTCSLANVGFYCELPNRLAFRNGLRTQAVENCGLVLVKHLDGIDLQHQRTSDLDESLPIMEDPQRPLHCQASPCHAKPSLAAPRYSRHAAKVFSGEWRP